MNISFKRPEDVLPSALILLALAILAVTLGLILLAPVQTKAAVDKSHKNSLRKLVNQISDLNRRADSAQKEAATRLWTGDPETVSTSVLGGLTAQANSLSLKVGAFRPQRIVQLDGLTELPFSVQITGPYTRVRKVLASYDTPTSKVAIRSAQIASSAQSSTYDVTATVQISAYIPTEAVAVIATPATNPTKAEVKAKDDKRLPPGVNPPRTVTVTTTHTGGANGSR